jgi:hypothetical protein
VRGRDVGFRNKTGRGLDAKRLDPDLGKDFSPRGSLARAADMWGPGTDVDARVATLRVRTEGARRGDHRRRERVR